MRNINSRREVFRFSGVHTCWSRIACLNHTQVKDRIVRIILGSGIKLIKFPIYMSGRYTNVSVCQSHHFITFLDDLFSSPLNSLFSNPYTNSFPPSITSRYILLCGREYWRDFCAQYSAKARSKNVILLVIGSSVVAIRLMVVKYCFV